MDEEKKCPACGGNGANEAIECENNTESGIADTCVCCGKTTVRSGEEKKRLINRLNRIEGQIRGIRGMIERNAYCNDILIQSAAVNAAVNAFNRDLIAHHIKSCVVRDLENGDESVIDELVETLKKLMK